MHNANKERTIIMKYKISAKKLIEIETLLLAFFIDIPVLNIIIVTMIPGLTGQLMTWLYLICGIFFIILTLLLMLKKRVNLIDSKLFLLIISISLGYLLTLIFAPYSDLTIIYFAIYTILSLCFVLLFQIDGKLLLKAIMTFPIIGILDISGIFTTNSYQYETITMGVSYAFMPTIVSSIVYFFAYYKGDNTKDKIINTLILSINMVYLFNVVQFGSRGVVLCFLMCFVFFFFLNMIMKKIGYIQKGLWYYCLQLF